MTERLLKLEFDRPSKRNPDETRSKYLHPESLLTFYIAECQEKLKHSGLRFSNGTAPCVEVLTTEEKKMKNEKEIYLERVSKLQGLAIDVNKKENYKVVGKAFMLVLGKTDGREYTIRMCLLNHLAPKVERFLNVILDENYSTYSDYEFTVFD